MASAGVAGGSPPVGRGASRVLLGVAAAVALGVFFGFRYFVNALNCVTYGEPDVRPAGRPDGRVRGLARCVGGIRCGLFRVGYTGHWPVRRALGLARCGGSIRCGLFRVGYTGHWPVRGRARPYALRRRYSLRFISRQLKVCAGTAVARKRPTGAVHTSSAR